MKLIEDTIRTIRKKYSLANTEYYTEYNIYVYIFAKLIVKSESINCIIILNKCQLIKNNDYLFSLEKTNVCASFISFSNKISNKKY